MVLGLNIPDYLLNMTKFMYIHNTLYFQLSSIHESFYNVFFIPQLGSHVMEHLLSVREVVSSISKWLQKSSSKYNYSRQ